jgi:hypothetical protein
MTSRSRRTHGNAKPSVGTEARPPRLVPEDEPHKPANTERSFIRIGDRRPGWSDLYHVVLLLLADVPGRRRPRHAAR